MVILGYFYREAREAASIDAAWRMATEALGTEPSTVGKSLGTTALKSSSSSSSANGMTTKPLPHPTPSLSRPSVSSSYLASLTRQASSLASTVGLTSISDISFGSTSDGSLFEFSEAERQKANSILNDAAAAVTATRATSSSASTSDSPTAAAPMAAVAPMVTMNTPSHGRNYRSPEMVTRGRSSSVWSSTASVSSVTQRSRNLDRGNVHW